MITSYYSLQAFNASRLLNIYWGVQLAVRGELAATQLLIAVVNLQVVINTTKQVGRPIDTDLENSDHLPT